MRCIDSTPDIRRQAMFAIVVAGCMMMEGSFMTWPNVLTDLIKANRDNKIANVSDPSYPRLTDYEAGWLASVPTIASIPFILLCGIMVNLIGLKGSTMLGLASAIVSWLLMGLASSKTALFIGRAISGAAFAFIVTVTQPLVSELVSPNIRGVTASLPRLFSNLGSLEVNIANIFLPWYTTTLLCTPQFVVLLFFILFVPESPYWLVKKGRKDAALSALKSLNPSTDNVEEVFQEVKKCVNLRSKSSGVVDQIRQMGHSSNYKPVMLMATLYVFYGSNGYSIVVPYSTLVFSQIGLPLDPRLCTIILGVVRFVVVIIGAFVTDLYGRRPLYIGSSVLSVLSFLTTIVSLTFTFIPKFFVVISICFATFSIGGNNLVTPILLGEIIPSAVQSVGCSLCIILETIMYCTFLFITPWLTNTISLQFVFLIPATINLFGGFVVWKWLPETKGRSLLEIQRAFE
ncbi:facilitated trehalose transporter Tret1-like isoform X2 [Oratosquilla oratoria]|uniref:facilitated trehalose transporter Tret1-like isoform X2 n=1 Tax=Oratosquilla oratoria TaxID=337810 RepID=UPI003F7651E0